MVKQKPTLVRSDERIEMEAEYVSLLKTFKTVPYVPLSHPFVERLIGTIRREYLDQTLFWTAADLEEKLQAF